MVCLWFNGEYVQRRSRFLGLNHVGRDVYTGYWNLAVLPLVFDYETITLAAVLMAGNSS